MADIFQALERFLENTADTQGRSWLLYLECGKKTVEDMLVTLPVSDVYPATRYDQTVVYVLLRWDCTLDQLKRVLGAGLLGRTVKEKSVKRLRDFLLGAKGTKVEEWSTVFSQEKVKFSQDLLNQFAVELKIDCTAMLMVLYNDLTLLFKASSSAEIYFKVFDTKVCDRLSITEEDAERLFRKHFRNSDAFMDQFTSARNAVNKTLKQELDFEPLPQGYFRG